MNLAKFSVARNFNKTFPIKNLQCFSSSPEASEKDLVKKTSLFDFHVARGGKIVNFAGYLLPVQYADQSLIQSHIHTRTPGCASIFDVSEGDFAITNVKSKSSFRSLTCCKRSLLEKMRLSA